MQKSDFLVGILVFVIIVTLFTVFLDGFVISLPNLFDKNDAELFESSESTNDPSNQKNIIPSSEPKKPKDQEKPNIPLGDKALTSVYESLSDFSDAKVFPSFIYSADQDPNICESVVSDDTLIIANSKINLKNLMDDFCVREKAIDTFNVQLCNGISIDFLKGFCATEINIEQIPDFCSKVDNDLAKDYCVILRLKDEIGYFPVHDEAYTSCGEIHNEHLKAYCIEAYKRKE